MKKMALVILIILTACSCTSTEVKDAAVDLTVNTPTYTFRVDNTLVPLDANMISCLTIYQNNYFASYISELDGTIQFGIASFPTDCNSLVLYDYYVAATEREIIAIAVKNEQSIFLVEKTDKMHILTNHYISNDNVQSIHEQELPFLNDDVLVEFFVGENDKLYFITEQNVYVADNTGQLELNIPSDNTILSAMVSSDGMLYIYTQTRLSNKNRAQTHVVQVDLIRGTDNLTVLVLDFNCIAITNGEALGYNIIAYDETSVYGFKLSDDVIAEVVLNLSEYGYSGSNLRSLSLSPEGDRLLAWDVQSGAGDSTQSVVLSFIKSNVEQQRQKLKFGTLEVSNELEKYIANFNKTNEYYYIETEVYSFENMQRLATEITVGDGPDVMDLRGIPVESLISSTVIEDLYSYIDNDASLSRNQFNKNILSLMEHNGSLYQVVPFFNVVSLVGASDKVGTSLGWNIADMKSIQEKYPSIQYAIPNISCETLLELICQYNMDSFVDWESGTCFFTSDEFISQLNYCATYPEKLYIDDYIEETDSIIMGYSFVLPVTISDFYECQFYEMLFEGDITYIGYPSQTTSGSAISPNSSLAMLTSSNTKEGAWEFLRGLLLEDYQMKNLNKYGFPIREDALIEMMNQARTVADEYIGGLSSGDVHVIYTSATEAQLAKIRDLIGSVDSILRADIITEIVLEESKSFFFGDRRADDVAQIIQGRVSILLSE